MALRARTDRRAHGRTSPKRARFSLVAITAFGALLSLLLHARAQDAAANASKTSASSSLYVRTDTDHTTVVTPRVHLSAPVADQTRVDLVYTADIWTSASIDIRTSASRVVTDPRIAPGPKPVTEQRDELDLSLEHAFTDLTVGGSYRYSKEYDYESHGGTLGGTYDFADKNASLGLTARAYFDQVGRAGDPGFARSASTLSARATFTQVIDKHTLGQLVYELSHQEGYLSSPYRYVRIASDPGEVPGTCAGVVKACVPENNPGSRLRHALAVTARRALVENLSLGASYRFYLDDWGVMSNTASIDAAWIPSERWLLSLGYRFYRQGAASHYQIFYLPTPTPTHVTSDKELSTLSSHRVDLEVSHAWRLDDLGTELRAVLVTAPTYYSYEDFLPLDHIIAIDVTAMLEVTL